MARKVADVFGFDELEKAFNRCEKKYPDAADAMLMAAGQQVKKRARALTPVYRGDTKHYTHGKPGKLRRLWKLKKVKEYYGGKVRVVRIENPDNIAQLVEYGHEIVHGGKSYKYKRTGEIITRGRNKGKQRMVRNKMNAVQRSARGIKSGGYVEGRHMLGKSMSEARQRFGRDAEKLLDRLTKDIQV